MFLIGIFSEFSILVDDVPTRKKKQKMNVVSESPPVHQHKAQGKKKLTQLKAKLVGKSRGKFTKEQCFSFLIFIVNVIS